MQHIIDDIMHDAGKVYQSADEVILNALAELRDCNREKLKKLREKIRLGCDQLDRGEYSSFEEAIARITGKTDKA